MKNVLLFLLFLLIVGCNKEFEPELTGWKAYTLPGRPIVHLEINGRERNITLPGDKNVGYRFAQFTKSENHIFLTQSLKKANCADYQIISADTTGTVIDTVYTAPPNTPLNLKLAPNDSLLLLKTYYDNCVDETSNFKYTFFNRYSKKSLPDTINVGNSWNIPLKENVWSPDSKKVLIQEWSGFLVKAFVYDLVTKDTTFVGKGSNFIWSPSDNNIVAYIKDLSIYTKNIATGENEILYEGRTKRSVANFRWSPNGDFLMIHLQTYLLNLKAPPLASTKIIYFSMKDKGESSVFFDNQQIDTWKVSSEERKQIR